MHCPHNSISQGQSQGQLEDHHKGSVHVVWLLIVTENRSKKLAQLSRKKAEEEPSEEEAAATPKPKKPLSAKQKVKQKGFAAGNMAVFIKPKKTPIKTPLKTPKNTPKRPKKPADIEA